MPFPVTVPSAASKVRPQVVDQRDGLAFQILARYVTGLHEMCWLPAPYNAGSHSEEAKTGVHSLINTSNLDFASSKSRVLWPFRECAALCCRELRGFNMHEDPIVCTPEDSSGFLPFEGMFNLKPKNWGTSKLSNSLGGREWIDQMVEADVNASPDVVLLLLVCSIKYWPTCESHECSVLLLHLWCRNAARFCRMPRAPSKRARATHLSWAWPVLLVLGAPKTIPKTK